MAAKSLREAFEKIPTWAWLVGAGIAVYLLYRKMGKIEKAVLSGQAMGGLNGVASGVIGPATLPQMGPSAAPVIQVAPQASARRPDEGRVTDLSGVVDLQSFEEFR
jgi:hypothetical protein